MTICVGSVSSREELDDNADLADRSEQEFTGKPGDTFSAPLRVRNEGDTALRGVGVMLYFDHALRMTLLAAGVVGFVVARRRKIRFIA